MGYRVEWLYRRSSKRLAWCVGLLAVVLSSCGKDVTVADEPDANVKERGVTRTDARPDEEDAGESNFMCGHSRCTNHPTTIAGATLNGYACCSDPERSACGVVELDTCVELNQPGHIDPTCQPVTSSLLGVLPGCCTPLGTCGSFESNVGVGCIQIPLVTPPGTCTH
jgi:hypothetical protein